MRRGKEARFVSRGVNFRIPLERYETLARVAAARGIDVSAVANEVIADALPGLTAWLTAWEARMRAAKEPPELGGPDD